MSKSLFKFITNEFEICQKKKTNEFEITYIIFK